MNYLKATTTDGQREYFNLDKILTLQDSADGTKIKIFMGAGLYWWVWADSLRITNLREILADMDETIENFDSIMGGKNKC